MEWHYNIIQNTQLNCPAQGPHIYLSTTHGTTVMQHGPKQTCSWASPATRVNEPWVQKYSTRLNRNKIEKTQECRLWDSRYGFSNNQVLLRKSFLTKFFISTFKIPQDHIQSWHDPYWDHETSYPTLSQTLIKFQLLNYDDDQRSESP